MRFKNYLNNNDVERIIELSIFMEEFDNINEDISGLKNKIKKAFSAIGITAEKEEQGLIQILLKSGKTLSAFFWYALKAATGNDDAKKKVKQLANTEVKKEDLIDFLMKLDRVTLHLTSEPIHMIEALTGWKIQAAVHKAYADTKDVTKKIHQALFTLEDAAKEAVEPIKKKISAYIKQIRKLALQHKKIANY